MIRTLILAGVAALALAQAAHASHWERRPDGSLYCAGSYPGIGAQGQLIEVCPPDLITPGQAEEYRRQYDELRDAETARQRTLNQDIGNCNPPKPGMMDVRPPSCR